MKEMLRSIWMYKFYLSSFIVVMVVFILCLFYLTGNNSITESKKAGLLDPDNTIKAASHPDDKISVASHPDENVLEFMGLEQDDPKLIDHIKKQIVQPSTLLPYKLYNGSYGFGDFSEFNQPKYAFQLFPVKHNGFFVEVGANDGETYSNTYYFERIYNWTGLLIECLPENVKKLLDVHRKAYVLNACVCPRNRSYLMPYMTRRGYLWGGVPLTNRKELTAKATVHYPCYPLYSILAALDRLQIDFLSLDIEGAEIQVLQTLPWEEVNIRVALIEHIFVENGLPALKYYMKKVGYWFVNKIANDGLFLRKKKGLVARKKSDS